MENTPAQPVLTDRDGTLLDIPHATIREDASRLRALLSSAHWHGGQLRHHQEMVNHHLDHLDRVVAGAEQALDSLLQNVSELTSASETESDRRESFATAISQPPSPQSEFADDAYDQLVQSVLLTPNGTHAVLTEEDVAMVNTPVPAKPPQTLVISGPLQSFSPSSPLAPYAFHGPTPAFVSAAGSISAGPSSTLSQPLFTRSRSPKKEGPETPVAGTSNTNAVSATVISGRTKIRNGVFVVLTSDPADSTIYKTWAKANSARGPNKTSPLLSYTTEKDAQQALQGYVRSKLVVYLHDPRYANAWFAVLKGRHPTICQRDELLKTIGKDHVKELFADDIVPAFTEEDAVAIYQDRNNMYQD
ncbi:hypothetical protein VNI00_010497 [Paramarasmius palmivorus]|uniref:Uncharacterized protein n=1 Tax=Paramarasmius palmivorus TaxID=297713 RepID=A0AAW0CJB1_9AGAR